MGFWEHLDELRERAIKCLWVFFLGFLGLYFVSDHILDLLREPLFSQLPEAQRHLYYTGLFENFLVHLKVSAYSSVFLFSPVYVYILWGFVAPGLTDQEKKHIKPFVMGGAFFFLIGVSFAYFVLFPAGVEYFLAYGTSAEVALLTLDAYVSVVLKILMGFGICFELPVIIVLLAELGVLSADQLEKQRRIAVIVIAINSAIVAPPDAISMLMLMAPLYLLFEGSIVVVKFLHKRRLEKNTAKS